MGFCLLDISPKGKAEHFEMREEMHGGGGDEGDGALKGLLLDALSWGVEEAGPLTHCWLNLHVVFIPAASRLR